MGQAKELPESRREVPRLNAALPPGHNLPVAVLNDAALLPRDEAGAPSITDVQFEALAAGIGRGRSMLCVAPTSTGKTLIGVWGVLTWLDGAYGRRAIYLVTHRALARQKFEELRDLLSDRLFCGDPSCIVLASGDTVEDGAGNVPVAPLDAPLLVATYEKYLAMLAGSGVRGDMTDCAVVCDEVQIIGDESRGRAVEMLLTLLRHARWGQLIALSAVLDPRDAAALADWLGVALVRCASREKHLIYECRTEGGVYTFDTGQAALGVRHRPRAAVERLATVDIVRELVARPENRPAVVFCMSRDRVYRLAAELADSRGTAPGSGGLQEPVFSEDTAAARQLSSLMARGVAFHTADLREDERRVVEDALARRLVDIVVATSTLAAGVNFPLGAVVFDSWRRWDDRRNMHVPLPESEFQNMAGRAGRMGSGHGVGRVVFTANGNAHQQRPAMAYLDPDRVTPLEPRLGAAAFVQVALQLLSSGLCATEDDICQFLLGTFSAYREREANRVGLDHWRLKVSEALGSLRDWGYVL